MSRIYYMKKISIKKRKIGYPNDSILGRKIDPFPTDCDNKHLKKRGQKM